MAYIEIVDIRIDICGFLLVIVLALIHWVDLAGLWLQVATIPAINLIQKVATDFGFFFIVLALIHWAFDTHWIISHFTSTLLLFFSDDTDDAAQFQYSCTCNRPAGNEFVVATCSGRGATSLVEYMGSVPAKTDIIPGIVYCVDLQ